MSSIRKPARVLTLAVGAVLLALPLAAVNQADAKTYKWNNTIVSGTSKRSLKVKYCDGTVKTLEKGTKTSKDVCAFWWPHNAHMYIFVPQTGTQLFDAANCGDGRWQKFTSKTDTSRTANVTVTTAWCA